MIDTHAHLYLDDFTDDLPQIIAKCRSTGIQEIWLPAINPDSLHPMDLLTAYFPGYFRRFAGLHPCDVKTGYEESLQIIKNALKTGRYAGIGEIGLDLYWDKTHLAEQLNALTYQLDLAVAYHLPVILHVRDAFEPMMPLIRSYYNTGLRGIFHSFAGTLEQAQELTAHGFLLGINGSITFKKSEQAGFLHEIPLEYLVTETDAPYLTPTPHRGKRNDSSYLPLIVKFLSTLYQKPENEIAAITTRNALNLF